MNETALQGAKRELFEETGLKDAYIHQFHAFSAVDRDPRERVITIAYFALVRISEVKGGDDAAKAQWFPLDKVPSLAFAPRRTRPRVLQPPCEKLYGKNRTRQSENR